WPDKSDVVEYVPSFIAVTTNAPEIKAYVAEFAAKRHQERLASLSKPASFEPKTRPGLQGKIFYESTNTTCGLVLIQTFTGENWREGQKLFLISDATNYQEITTFQSKVVSHACLIQNSSCDDVSILASVAEDPNESPFRFNIGQVRSGA